MTKSNYNIEYLPSFNEDFEQILIYITYKLKNKKAAIKLLEDVSNAIMARSINSEGFEVYKSMKDRRCKWYRIYVGNYTILYTIKDNVMIVSRIIYSKRNFDELV